VTVPGGDTVVERELRDFCLQRASAYKVPERIEVVESLPRTASGKLIRHQIRLGE
jgi:acyl-CoA synthetase (AMP-forming)/AMP-acid ligase II